MYAIDCQDITKSYQKLRVLKGVSMQIREGDLVSILGASGAGKSTLLNIIGSLDSADGGMVLLYGRDVGKMNAKQLAILRNQEIGFIFQFHHLLPEFSALENVLLPSAIGRQSEKTSRNRAKELLDRLGMAERMTHRPGELSGGEQQRVALARALINKPRILLADEPTGNLDQENARQVLQLIFELRREQPMTTLLVTHDPQVAARADHSIMMKDGKIVE
ncbi:MAG: ABC transporter ATP-binding protein [Saprospiraceae bacterium]|jgi:lipoprotein-releasing system ATP-binding protein|nr:ABC transporter ATP-binding protein [Saprospiraceae bacterium]MBP9208845.1 ABC transporter ATP-binding protein [Saprospiraceae bacterium]MBV6472029.1 Lipoprotein-releasing system ATP-binding protein LolD [Saprospiraceae bacterium]